MAYEVTATRKRPQLFDNLVGQEFVVSTIKNSIEQGRIAHAYLFSGSRGVGKTSSARILAKALNCEQGPTAYPCGVCSHCKEITQGNAPDVIEIDGASNTSVNDVRVIKDEVLFPPQSSRYKIYIIDEVHMLSTSAFNALLKTIEEPPAYIVFIFATTETQKVPATIRSRCQQFHFQLIPLETIKKVLAETVEEMNVSAEDEALFWIAKEATGSMRDAYTLFDQVLAFSNGAITLEKIEQKLGLAGTDKISAIMEALLQEHPDQALRALNRLLDGGVSVEQCVKDLGEYIRTLLLIKRNITNESVLGLQVTQIPAAIREAYSEEQLEAALELFLQLYRDIRFSINPRFELELAVSRLTNLRHMASSATLVKKIEQLKKALSSGDFTNFQSFATPQPVITKPVPTPVIATPIADKKVTQELPQPEKADSVKSLKPITKALLPELIQELAAERDPVGMVLSQAIDVHQDEKGLRFIFASNYALENAKQNEATLRKLILRHTGYDGKIEFLKEETKEEPKLEKATPTDDIAQTIATMFRGEVLLSQ